MAQKLASNIKRPPLKTVSVTFIATITIKEKKKERKNKRTKERKKERNKEQRKKENSEVSARANHQKARSPRERKK